MRVFVFQNTHVYDHFSVKYAEKIVKMAFNPVIWQKTPKNTHVWRIFSSNPIHMACALREYPPGIKLSLATYLWANYYFIKKITHQCYLLTYHSHFNLLVNNPYSYTSNFLHLVVNKLACLTDIMTNVSVLGFKMNGTSN